MSETQNFYALNLKLDSLVQALTDWYRAQSFNVQVLNVPGGGTLIQASQEGTWRNVVGMSSALNVVLRQKGGELTVEIGAGKWMDKALAAGVAWFVLWPLLFTAAYGAWKQSNLPKLTFEFIQQFVSTGGSSPLDLANLQSANPEVSYGGVVTPTPTPSVQAAPVQSVSYQFCANCGASVSENDRFCTKCGHKLL